MGTGEHPSPPADSLPPEHPPELEEFSTRPLSLVVVAGLFILLGFLSALEFVISMIKGDFVIPLGVLCFFIGIGLLRHRPGGKTCALSIIYLGFLMSSLVAVSCFWDSRPWRFHCPEER